MAGETARHIEHDKKETLTQSVINNQALSSLDDAIAKTNESLSALTHSMTKTRKNKCEKALQAALSDKPSDTNSAKTTLTKRASKSVIPSSSLG